MKTSIFFLLSMLLLAVSCKKTAEEPVGPPAYYSIAPEILQYLKLPAGHYFIYEDSISGQTDSVVVQASELQKMYSAAYSYEHEDWVSHVKKNLLVPAFYYDSLTLVMNDELNGQPWLDVRFKQSAANSADIFSRLPGIGQSNTDAVFWYPMNRYANTDIQGCFAVPTLTVGGETFTDVLRFVYTQSEGTAAVKRTNFYWAKNIGIIKREITSNTENHSWTLLRHGQ